MQKFDLSDGIYPLLHSHLDKPTICHEPSALQINVGGEVKVNAKLLELWELLKLKDGEAFWTHLPITVTTECGSVPGRVRGKYINIFDNLGQ